MRDVFAAVLMSVALGGCFGLFGGRGDDDDGVDPNEVDRCAVTDTFTVDIKAELKYRDESGSLVPASGGVLTFINRATDEVLGSDTADGSGAVRIQNAPVMGFDLNCDSNRYDELADYVVEAEKGVLFKRQVMEWQLNRLDDEDEVQSGVVDLRSITLE